MIRISMNTKHNAVSQLDPAGDTQHYDTTAVSVLFPVRFGPNAASLVVTSLGWVFIGAFMCHS